MCIINKVARTRIYCFVNDLPRLGETFASNKNGDMTFGTNCGWILRTCACLWNSDDFFFDFLIYLMNGHVNK